MRVLLTVAIILAARPVQASNIKLFLVSGPAGKTPNTRPVSARLGEPVDLFVVVRRGRGRRAHYFADTPSFRLGRRTVRRRIAPLSALAGASVRWYRVEPRPHHVKTAPPNAGNPAYSNAVLFGKRHGRWLGYDTIEYHETAISGAGGGRLRVKRSSPTHAKVNVNGGLGTMRYKVAVTVDGQTHATPGAEASGTGGISTKVARVTFRSGDRWTDHLRGFFNVPNVFGSGGHGRSHQTERYQGADCADVISGGLRAAGAKVGYTSAAGLKRYARPVTTRLMMTREGIFALSGKRTGDRVTLRFGEDVRSGDIMLIDYAGFAASPRSWDHVAVVDRDQGKIGQFDPKDPVLHMGYLYGLTEEPAGDQAPAIIQFLRLRPSIQRTIRPK